MIFEFFKFKNYRFFQGGVGFTDSHLLPLLLSYCLCARLRHTRLRVCPSPSGLIAKCDRSIPITWYYNSYRNKGIKLLPCICLKLNLTIWYPSKNFKDSIQDIYSLLSNSTDDFRFTGKFYLWDPIIKLVKIRVKIFQHLEQWLRY